MIWNYWCCRDDGYHLLYCPYKNWPALISVAVSVDDVSALALSIVHASADNTKAIDVELRCNVDSSSGLGCAILDYQPHPIHCHSKEMKTLVRLCCEWYRNDDDVGDDIEIDDDGGAMTMTRKFFFGKEDC
jgi:hypothetical protein